ncbi:DUF2442 domain-containing protein [Gallionella capsiferriformans]|jgi:hypothetical protein|uniref:DUF2442 domain-containing protein n=1 Tax=Gallionella capsiferriformans (strain ES-2) TaxID=395494 RepID=D9SGU7_GALCS|nr:DUF2442 domain-containing protein [Gallionella capsiferriformans]ADL55744.1 Protein of unknown function DUF2442 [Gallionella capsiferriformans ES-2]
MKLRQFEQQQNYIFGLTFANGEFIETDLTPLIKDHVNATELASARIDQDWGCLEFKDGAVDIEPDTLYKWAKSHISPPH